LVLRFKTFSGSVGDGMHLIPNPEKSLIKIVWGRFESPHVHGKETTSTCNSSTCSKIC